MNRRLPPRRQKLYLLLLMVGMSTFVFLLFLGVFLILPDTRSHLEKVEFFEMLELHENRVKAYLFSEALEVAVNSDNANMLNHYAAQLTARGDSVK